MMNKNRWKVVSEFTFLSVFPALPCPYCSSDTLSLENDSIQYRSLSGEALRQCIKKFQLSKTENIGNDNSLLNVLIAALEIAGQSMHTPSQFVAFFKCSMCNESVSSFGIARVPVDPNNSGIQIKVESFNPPIPIFELSKSTPSSINNELVASFSYFFSDTCSSGIRLRRALEKLCEELGFRESNLHRSIESMGKEYPQESKWLMPLKLVGNEATHSDGIVEDDILDCYEIFQVVLSLFQRKEIEDKTNKVASQLENKYQRLKG